VSRIPAPPIRPGATGRGSRVTKRRPASRGRLD